MMLWLLLVLQIGVSMGIQNYEHQVSILHRMPPKTILDRVEPPKYLHSCGGTIVKPALVLSSQQCLLNRDVTSYVVSVGSTCSTDGTFYPVDKLTATQDQNFFELNLGVLKLLYPIVFTDKVKAIKISWTMIGSGVSCTATGFGSAVEDLPSSTHFREIQMVTLSNDQCQKMVSYPIQSYHLCASSVNGTGPETGDYGGPLVLDGKLVAVSSYGLPTAVGQPYVFIRLRDRLVMDWFNIVSKDLGAHVFF